MKFSLKSLVTALVIVNGSIFSSSVLAQADDEYATAKQKVESVLGLKVESIGDAPVPGLLQVSTDRGLFYTSEDGTYFLQARVFNLDEGMRNETEEALSELRVEGLEAFDGSTIEFKADKEKYVVNVFTDITCGYCRKLHNEIADYNDLGITVRYLAYPRAGLNSGSYNDMVSVWCAKDQQEAMTSAKAGDSVLSARCSNEVAQQYQFGQRIGVTGTPNIILPDGSMIPGYQPAKQLEQALKDVM